MPERMKNPFIVLGAGGHAGVVIDMLKSLCLAIKGVSDNKLPVGSSGPLGTLVIGNDEDVLSLDANTINLAMGLGSTGSVALRASVFDKFKSAGFYFPALVHPSAIVSQNTIVKNGAQVMAGAVVQTGAELGGNCLINTSASVDHDCRIGESVHIAPGAVLSGNVDVGCSTHIGAGATIIQSLSIGENVVVGAGVCVLKDVPAKTIIRTNVWSDNVDS